MNPIVVEFLLARLGEVEADAHAAAEVNPPPWRMHQSRMGGDTGLVVGGETPANRYLDGALWDNEGADSLSMEVPTAWHIARHDPARVLAWCAALRAIVELHAGVHECVAWRWQDAEEIAEGEPRRTRTVYVREGFEHSDDPTLLALAQLFADHPDFDPAWRL